MTKLAVSIAVHSLDQARQDAELARDKGADLVEYRIDAFTEDPLALRQLVDTSPVPCIVTCRPVWEGGEYDGDDQTRISLFEHIGLADHPPAYLDVELEAWRRSANLRQKVGLVIDHPGQVRPTATGLVLSSHDFEGRPADLIQRVEAMASAAACRVIKLAWRARSLRDNLEAFELLQQRIKPTIALCMGEEGLPSRVLAKKFGALLTFAALDDSSATAPGQPTIDDLRSLYRWDRLTPQTRVYGVIGDPVGHSMSPAIHNAGFDAVDFDGVYLPMRIPPDYVHFKATVASWLAADGLDFRGASVTLPHKENLIRFVTEQGGEVEELARRIGAANTLVVRDDASLYACNTDYAAALDAVCDSLDIERAGLAGQRVAVVGAGGVGRALVAGFASHGATVVVYNRTFERADQLAAEFADLPGKVVAARMEKLCDSCCTIFANATSVGMAPKVDQTPMPLDLMTSKGKGWGPGSVVFDTIYNPVRTKLLRDAAEQGAMTISGRDMFIRQGAAQFELWTGKPAPKDVFEQVMVRRMGA